AHKGPERRGLRQQRRVLKRDIKSQPTAAQLERQTYMAGTQPNQSMYDIRQSAPPADSLAAYRGLIDGMTGAAPASLLDPYRGAGGGEGGEHATPEGRRGGADGAAGCQGAGPGPPPGTAGGATGGTVDALGASQPAAAASRTACRWRWWWSRRILSVQPHGGIP